jgi:hypothetical protein
MRLMVPYLRLETVCKVAQYLTLSLLAELAHVVAALVLDLASDPAILGCALLRHALSCAIARLGERHAHPAARASDMCTYRQGT